MNAASRPELEIVGGLHKGASIALDDGEYSIGSTANAGIILTDAGVAPQHAILRIDRFATHIEATGGDVGVNGKLITQDHGCRVRLPGAIAIGEARIKLTRAGEGSGLVPGALAPLANFVSARPFMAAGSIVFCALAFSIASRGLPISPNPSVQGPVKGNGEKASAAVTPSLVQEAATKLSTQLRSVGINSLKITPADQHVAVSGSVARRDANAWANTQQWFDETYSGRIVLTANVAVGDSKDLPAIRLQAIWYGERPYVILEDGSHYYEGAVLDSGWTLQRIAEDRVVLQKGGETLALTYR